MARMKIAHLSDLHIGYGYGAAKSRTTARVNDGYHALRRVVSEVISEEVDAVVIAGDIFHSPAPDVRSIVFVQNQLRRLSKARIPVYSLAGNHDTNDVKEDISACAILNDPARRIYSHVEPYATHEIAPGVLLHMVSHHMYEEQHETMKRVKSQDGAINIFTTHGSVIDPLLKIQLHTKMSPREIVIPEFMLSQNNWDYIMLGHIHERGFVGSKDKRKDLGKTKTFYNGSLIRRGFADKECALGRGWTLWTVNDDGSFVPDFRVVPQRPQMDFPLIDARSMTAKQVSDVVIERLRKTQSNGDNSFDVRTAPILRQYIVNMEPSKRASLDWANIHLESEHALKFHTEINPIVSSDDDVPVLQKQDENPTGGWKTIDVVRMYDDWVDGSSTVNNAQEDIRDKIRIQARHFVGLGQEETLDDE